MKIAEDATFGYSSGYWTNTQLLNENSDVNENNNAKYAEFNNVPFSKLRMCIGSPTNNCVEHEFDKEYSSARELFSAGYIRDPTVDQQGILDAFGPTEGSYQKCGMQVNPVVFPSN